jgi:hypothetical protein
MAQKATMPPARYYVWVEDADGNFRPVSRDVGGYETREAARDDCVEAVRLAVVAGRKAWICHSVAVTALV